MPALSMDASVMLAAHAARAPRCALRCVALRCGALRCVALRCIALRCVALRCVALRCVALRCVALCCAVLCCVALGCVLSCCIALRCVVLCCVVFCSCVAAPSKTHFFPTQTKPLFVYVVILNNCCSVPSPKNVFSAASSPSIFSSST